MTPQLDLAISDWALTETSSSLQELQPCGWYIKIYQNQEKDRQEELPRAKEENKSKTEQLSQSPIEGHKQNS